MKSKRVNSGRAYAGHRQQSLFPPGDELQDTPSDLSQDCQVVAVGKRRDGAMRYWCPRHKADATAKYGVPATLCRASHIPPISAADTLALRIEEHAGGIALWGAVPPVYDTTKLPMDRGIHVHARARPGAEKEIDGTFRAVRILGSRLPEGDVSVSEIDAIYYMATSIFGYEMKYIRCPYCGEAHLDRDWFGVHPHRRHLCAGCGRHFPDDDTAIGNPICGVGHACGVTTHHARLSQGRLDIRQVDFPAGIQVWGSNPAFIWTSETSEAEGIHVHAYHEDCDRPELDETYAEVTIDRVSLDPIIVRILMAQAVMPSLKNRVLPIDCPSCGRAQFSVGDLAFTPVSTHTCTGCGRRFQAPGRLRKTIANPLPAILARLSETAPRQPQEHDLDLISEMP